MKIKRIFSFQRLLFGFLLLLFTICVSSCSKDEGITSGSNTGDVQKFLGLWHVSDNAARLNYDVTIKRNPVNSQQIYFSNFADLNGQVTGLVVGNSIVIDKQKTGQDTDYVEGTGTYKNNSRLEFTYTLDDNIDTVVRSAVFTK